MANKKKKRKVDKTKNFVRVIAIILALLMVGGTAYYLIYLFG